MDDIIDKLSSDDPRFTHLDLREVKVKAEDLKTIADKLENNTVLNRVSWVEGHCYDATYKKRIDDKVRLNNVTFQRYPNDFVLGLLSCHAYNDSEHDASVGFSSNSGVANVDACNEELNGWTVSEVFDAPGSGGYYSVAYLNEGKKQTVLAHRGTKYDYSDLCRSESPLKTDLEGILGGKMVKQQHEAYATTKKVVAHAKDNGYNLSFTGHSLGAWLAELSVYFAVNDFNFHCKAVTFDSPGSASTLDSFKPNVKSHDHNAAIRNLDITTYLSAPNFVNCCNPHIGKVFRIFPDISWINNTDKLRSIMQKIPVAKDFEPTLMGLLSINGHRIKPIVATFNPVTGKPKTFEKVEDWPCLKHQSKATDATTEKVLANTLTGFVRWLDIFPGVGWFLFYTISKSTFFSFVEAIDNFVNGNIDSHEFWKVYQSSNFIFKKEEETVHLSSEEQYYLKYEGHYSTRELTPFKDSYNRESSDWYLNKLCKLSTKEINGMKICDDLKRSLNTLKSKYRVKFEPVRSRKYICSKSSDVNIDALRENITRLCEIYRELKEVFDDKHAFLPQDKTPTQSWTVSSNLPLYSNNFLERQEVMEEIGKVLHNHQFVVISGLGGIGKSTIAVEYGRDLKKKSSHQIVRIVHADIPRKIYTAYKEIAGIDLGINVQDHAANVMQSVHSRIANLKLPVLFIFDNVERYGDVETYLRGISNIENVKVIITTRHNDLSQDLRTINLNPFTKDEAKLYVKNTTGNRFSASDIDKLVNTLVGESFNLPYNLSLAVEYFKQNPLHKIERCIEDLAKCNGETATFLLLDLINTSKLSWLVLQYSAHLDPDFISVDIFKELLSVDEDVLQNVIKKLESSGLMSFRILKNGLCGLKLHRVLQDLVKRYVSVNKGLNSMINKPDIFERTLKVLYNLSLSKKGVPIDYFQLSQIKLHTTRIINDFLRWLGEFNNITNNTVLFAKKAKRAIDKISYFGPCIKNYVGAANYIANGVTGGDGGRSAGPTLDYPPLWFENLQTFTSRAVCIEWLSSEFGSLIKDQVELDSQMFQRYPNDFVLGLFSCHAYTDAKKNAYVEFSSKSGVADVAAWNDELKNWTVYEVFDDPESGYYSVAYLNEYKKHMVLAHRDTTLKLWDFVKDEEQIGSQVKFGDLIDSKSSPWTGFEGISDGKIEEELEKAYVATQEVIKHAKENGYSVAFTGHSLGAYLAEFSLAWGFVTSFKCKVVTFDKPEPAYVSGSHSLLNRERMVSDLTLQLAKRLRDNDGKLSILSRRFACHIKSSILSRRAKFEGDRKSPSKLS